MDSAPNEFQDLFFRERLLVMEERHGQAIAKRWWIVAAVLAGLAATSQQTAETAMTLDTLAGRFVVDGTGTG